MEPVDRDRFASRFQQARELLLQRERSLPGIKQLDNLLHGGDCCC
jgi:hypothetical protein